MKKILRFSTAVLSIVILSCGCADEKNSSVQISKASEISSRFEESSAQGTETFLTGLDGKRILTSEITRATGYESGFAELSESDFTSAVCEGFVYVAEPSKESRNNKDNSDVFNSAEMSFSDMTIEPLKNFKRVNIGETVCGLTLKEAETNFARGFERQTFETSDGSRKTGAELNFPEIYFTGGSAVFEGELTMTGYICRVAADEYGVAAGDILFVPCDGEADFPVMSYSLDGVNGFYHSSRVYSMSGLTWQNEFGYILLGNVSDVSADVSPIPRDGSFVKCRVTVENIELHGGVNSANSVTAELLDISRLS